MRCPSAPPTRDDAPPRERRPAPLDLLDQINRGLSESRAELDRLDESVKRGLSEVRAELDRLDESVKRLAGVVEPIAVAYDFSMGIAWPRNPIEWARQLRPLREEAGLTRTKLAVLAGVADSTLRNIETGRHVPSKSIIRRLLPVMQTLGEKNRKPQTEEDK